MSEVSYIEQYFEFKTNKTWHTRRLNAEQLHRALLMSRNSNTVYTQCVFKITEKPPTAHEKNKLFRDAKKELMRKRGY